VSATLGQGLSPVRAALSNGAVLTAQETSMTPAVTIHVACRAGSMFDPPDLSGLSYLTACVLDRGTSRRSADTIAAELDDRGVSLKVSTNRHALTVSCTCLSEDFDDVLGIVADVVRRPVFPEGEIARRRAEAITTLRQREDNPASRAVDAVHELLYTRQHPYGRPSKGTAEGVERTTRDDMVAFHAAHVRPGGLSLVVVGSVPPSHAIERAAAEFEGWSMGMPERLVIPPPPSRAGREERVIVMPGKTQTDIACGFPAVRRVDPRFYAYWMMNNILGQSGLGGRLADNIRERQGMAYYAFSTFDSNAGEGPLLIRAGVDPANVSRALEAIDQEVARLGSGGPTTTEVEETRAYLVGSIPRMFETNASIASFLQSAEEFGLGLDFDQRLPALLAGVTLNDVRQAAAEVLDPARAAVVIAGPDAAEARVP
jgi:zinc protease